MMCGEYQFQCTWCKGSNLIVAKGGDTQVRQHAKTIKHREARKLIKTESVTKPTIQLKQATLVDVGLNTKDDTTEVIPARFLTFSDKILRGEAIIGLSQAENDISFRAMSKVVSNFKDIDEGSKIWSKIEMGKTKINYVTTFGIGKYQENRIKKELKETEGFTLYIDTSTFHQKSDETGALAKDIDFIVHYFSESSQRIEVHYLSTVFLVHETASVQIDTILSILEKFGMK